MPPSSLHMECSSCGWPDFMSDGIHALQLVLHTSNHVEPLCQWGRSKAETRTDGVWSFILRASKLEYRSRGGRSIARAPHPRFGLQTQIYISRRVAEGTLRGTWTIGYLNHYQRHADKKEHPAQCGLEEAQAVEVDSKDNQALGPASTPSTSSPSTTAYCSDQTGVGWPFRTSCSSI